MENIEEVDEKQLLKAKTWCPCATPSDPKFKKMVRDSLLTLYHIHIKGSDIFVKRAYLTNYTLTEFTMQYLIVFSLSGLDATFACKCVINLAAHCDNIINKRKSPKFLKLRLAKD